MTHRCSKCGRRMKAATPSGMGPVCARAMLGAKQKRRRAAAPLDARQRDFFAEDLSYAQRVDALLSGISLEVAP